MADTGKRIQTEGSHFSKFAMLFNKPMIGKCVRKPFYSHYCMLFHKSIRFVKRQWVLFRSTVCVGVSRNITAFVLLVWELQREHRLQWDLSTHVQRVSPDQLHCEWHLNYALKTSKKLKYFFFFYICSHVFFNMHAFQIKWHRRHAWFLEEDVVDQSEILETVVGMLSTPNREMDVQVTRFLHISCILSEMPSGVTPKSKIHILDIFKFLRYQL